ncbi:hypothetical protein D3C72_2004290 [compost metagenome]
MSALFTPGFLAGKQEPVLGLELLDALDQQFQLGCQCMQFGIFHGLSTWWGVTGTI